MDIFISVNCCHGNPHLCKQQHACSPVTRHSQLAMAGCGSSCWKGSHETRDNSMGRPPFVAGRQERPHKRGNLRVCRGKSFGRPGCREVTSRDAYF